MCSYDLDGVIGDRLCHTIVPMRLWRNINEAIFQCTLLNKLFWPAQIASRISRAVVSLDKRSALDAMARVPFMRVTSLPRRRHIALLCFTRAWRLFVTRRIGTAIKPARDLIDYWLSARSDCNATKALREYASGGGSPGQDDWMNLIPNTCLLPRNDNHATQGLLRCIPYWLLEYLTLTLEQWLGHLTPSQLNGIFHE